MFFRAIDTVLSPKKQVIWSKTALDVLVFEKPMSKAIGLQLNNKRKKSQSCSRVGWATNLLAMGLEIEVIVKATGLSRSEIETLANPLLNNEEFDDE